MTSSAYVPDYGPVLSVDAYGPFTIGGTAFGPEWIACTVDYGLEHGTAADPLPIVALSSRVEVTA